MTDRQAGEEVRVGDVWQGKRNPSRTVEVTNVLHLPYADVDVRYKVLTGGAVGRSGACFHGVFLSRYERATPTASDAAAPTGPDEGAT